MILADMVFAPINYFHESIVRTLGYIKYWQYAEFSYRYGRNINIRTSFLI